MIRENGVLTWVWLGLVSATLLNTTAPIAGIVVLAVAAIKVGLVIHRFMEIGRGSQGWEWFFVVWLLGVSSMLMITSMLA